MPNRFIYQVGDTQSDGIQQLGKFSYMESCMGSHSSTESSECLIL